MPYKIPRRRATLVLLMMVLGLGGLGVRLGYVQGVRAGDYTDLAEQQRLRTIVLPAVRGAIYDRSGRELALSIPARTVYANPKQIGDKAGTAAALAPILGMRRSELLAKLSKPKGFVYLARRVDVEVARKIERLGRIGIGTLEEPRRFYPGGTLGANVLGFVGTDAGGLAGLEASYGDLLGGKPGRRVLEQDPEGRAIPQGMFLEEAPVAGADLVLTLDRDIQHAAEAALEQAVEDTGAKAGSVVVADPRTGELLAMASWPTHDPNDFKDLDPANARNRVVTDVYEPGSVNKVVTAAAALESGVVTPDTRLAVPSTLPYAGRVFKDAHGHATKSMSFTEIIADSSNVGTIRVAVKLGPQRLYDYLRRFGYGRSTALGFPGEGAGILPRTDRWKTSLPTMAIGQGVSATALQLARVFATVANDGVAVEPKLVSGWVDPAGDFHRAPASRSSRVLSAATAAQLRAILARVVTDGTGTMAQIPGYPTAGKTGTAQKPGPRGGYSGYMASFFGFAPVEEPRLVVGVVLDEPSPIWGGVVAAPVFRDVGAAALRILRIPPQVLPEPTTAGRGVADLRA